MWLVVNLWKSPRTETKRVTDYYASTQLQSCFFFWIYIRIWCRKSILHQCRSIGRKTGEVSEVLKLANLNLKHKNVLGCYCIRDVRLASEMNLLPGSELRVVRSSLLPSCILLFATTFAFIRSTYWIACAWHYCANFRTIARNIMGILAQWFPMQDGCAWRCWWPLKIRNQNLDPDTTRAWGYQISSIYPDRGLKVPMIGSDTNRGGLSWPPSRMVLKENDCSCSLHALAYLGDPYNALSLVLGVFNRQSQWFFPSIIVCSGCHAVKHICFTRIRYIKHAEWHQGRRIGKRQTKSAPQVGVIVKTMLIGAFRMVRIFLIE